MVLFALALAQTPTIPPGLPKLPTPPGVTLRLERTVGRDLRLTIVNGSNRRVRGHWAGFACNNRAFAQRLGGGPILAERNWTVGFPCRSVAMSVLLDVKPHAADRYAEEDLVSRLRLPKGTYRVWDLAYEALDGAELVSNAVVVRVP